MRVLRRKLFNRGGYAHRGTGITSGLTPVQRFQGGGQATIRPEMLPAWMTFFGNLAPPTFKTGLGAGFEGIREAAKATAPVLAEGIAAGRGKERRIIKGADGYNYYADTGERVLKDVEKEPKYETREVSAKDNMVQLQESYDGGLTWKNLGEPYSRWKPSDEKDDKRLTREYSLENNMIQDQESLDGGKTWTNVGEPRNHWEPKSDETKRLTQEVPLANNMIQNQVSTDNGQTWKNVGVPYPRFKPDSTSTKRITQELSLENNMIQDQESFDGGKTWNNVGVPRHQWEPKDKETKRITQSIALEDNMMQDQESFDGGKTWADVGTSYTRYKPDKDTETKRLTRSVPLDDDMLQDQESYDNGTTWNDVGTEYHQWKPGDKGEWKYNSLTTKEVIKKDGKKYKQTIGVYSRTLKGQEPEWKDQLIFEEQIIPGDPKRSSSGNIVMTSGPNEGKTFGAIEFQDGTVMYYDPLNPDRDTRGFVIPDGTYNFFESTLMGDRATVFGKVNMQDVAENASVLSQTLSTGGSLLKQGLMLNNDLDTFQRNILKYGGDFLGQFGTFGDEMRQGLYNYFGADDKALNQFVFEARTFVAQMITPITGETTGRISEPERELSNEALGLFHGIQDAQTAMVAIEAATAITYLSQHRNMYVLNAPNVNKVWDPTGENALNKDAVNFHLNRFQALGFSAPTAKRLIERMRDMEMLGLAELQNITDKEKAYFADKSSVSKDLSVIIPPGQ